MSGFLTILAYKDRADEPLLAHSGYHVPHASTNMLSPLPQLAVSAGGLDATRSYSTALRPTHLSERAVDEVCHDCEIMSGLSAPPFWRPKPVSIRSLCDTSPDTSFPSQATAPCPVPQESVFILSNNNLLGSQRNIPPTATLALPMNSTKSCDTSLTQIGSRKRALNGALIHGDALFGAQPLANPAPLRKLRRVGTFASPSSRRDILSNPNGMRGAAKKTPGSSANTIQPATKPTPSREPTGNPFRRSMPVVAEPLPLDSNPLLGNDVNRAGAWLQRQPLAEVCSAEGKLEFCHWTADRLDYRRRNGSMTQGRAMARLCSNILLCLL